MTREGFGIILVRGHLQETETSKGLRTVKLAKFPYLRGQYTEATDGTWGVDYQEGGRFTYEDGTATRAGGSVSWSKTNYFNPEGYAVTGWNQIQDTWYYMYEDGERYGGGSYHRTAVG